MSKAEILYIRDRSKLIEETGEKHIVIKGTRAGFNIYTRRTERPFIFRDGESIQLTQLLIAKATTSLQRQLNKTHSSP